MRFTDKYGERLAFWGGIDTNYVLPRGRSSEVINEVKERIGIFAPGGGYILNPIHNIQPDVPPCNILSMVDACMKYGKYPIQAK